MLDRLIGIEHGPNRGMHRVFDPQNRLFTLFFQRGKL